MQSVDQAPDSREWVTVWPCTQNETKAVSNERLVVFSDGRRKNIDASEIRKYLQNPEVSGILAPVSQF